MIVVFRSDLMLRAASLALTAVIPSLSPAQPAMLPPEAEGWTRTDSVGVYAGKDLFLLIDGGADLFFEYGFVRALSSEYVRPPGTRAATELYEMKSPAAAYGVFSSFTAGTGTAVPVGQEAVLGNGYCIFWKGTHVGMLTAASDDSAAGPMLVGLAEGLAKGIHSTGERPGLCTILRKGGLDSRNMVFIRGKLALGNQLRTAWASAFPPAEGVVGASGAFRYLILDYGDAEAAGAALGRAAAAWEGLDVTAVRDSLGGWIARQPDEGVTIVQRVGRYVLAVSGKGESPESLGSSLRALLEAL